MPASASRPIPAPLRALGGLLALYLLVPLAAFVWRLSTSHERGFSQPGLESALWTSALAATISTVIVALLGIPLAWWLARSRRWVARAVGVLIYLPLALPPVMSGMILIYVVGPYTWLGNLFHGNLTDTLAGVVIAQTFVASPFLIIAARTSFAGVSPHLDDLAATLGHRPLARFWRVDLRIAAPGIRAGLLLTWMRALGEYGATVLLAYHPFTLPVFTEYQFSSSGIPTTQAPTALAVGLAIVLLLLAQLRRPSSWMRKARIPQSRVPERPDPLPIAFDIEVYADTFHLQVSHQASSPWIAILGRSGAGKSLTLRSIAGLLGTSAGTVRVGHDNVGHLPTEARHLGYIPQDHGLLPDRTAWQNICFGAQADPSLAAWWAETLQISELADRLPDQLSGGQRQRVSMAQALSHQPRVVLLDEPFSALDAPIRAELRTVFRRLQRERGLATVLVTHDPEEAATLADEIIVIDEGRVLQAGPTREVYGQPSSAEVARLLGIANINRAVSAGAGGIALGATVLPTSAHDVREGEPVLWAARPEMIQLTPSGMDATLTGTVVDRIDLGPTALITLHLDGLDLQARTNDPAPIGSTCRLSINPSDIWVWPAS